MDFSKNNNHKTKNADEQQQQQQNEDGNEDKKEENEETKNNSEDSPKTTDSEKTVVITLKGTHLGSTDTEGIIEYETSPAVESKEPRHVSFKDSNSSVSISTEPSTRSKAILKVRTSASAPAIVIQHDHSEVEEQLESVLPNSEPHSEPDYPMSRLSQSSDARIEHIFSLFDRFTKNLETIENVISSENQNQSTKEPTKKSSSSKDDDLVQVHKSHFEIHQEIGHHERRSSRSSRSSHHQSSCSSELRITQLFQLPCVTRQPQYPEPQPSPPPSLATHERGETNADYTYIQAPSYIVDLTANVTPTATQAGTLTKSPNVGIKQPEQLKYPITKQPKRPPCERTFHTITISANSPVHPPRNNYNPSLMTRCGDAFTDFATAICLCLQVNKDCVFCLGFFVAFVVSASFLTAFFYRTLNMAPQTIHIQQEGIYNDNPTTVRLSGFYYIHNRHHPVPPNRWLR